MLSHAIIFNLLYLKHWIYTKYYCIGRGDSAFTAPVNKC